MSAAVVKDGLYNLASIDSPAWSVSIEKESAKKGAKALPAKRDMANWSQKWLVVRDEATGYYTLRNMRSRFMLAVSGAAKSGAALKQAKAVPSASTRWQLVKGDSGMQFRLAANPSLAIAVATTKANGLKLVLRPAKDVAAQQFRLRKAKPLEDGKSYFIRSAENPKQGLAVKGASKKANAKIALEKKSSMKSQKFRLHKVGSSYRMQCVQSCQYVSASKKSIKQKAGTVGKAKKWNIALDLATGTFKIKSVSTKKFIDATSGKLALRRAAIQGEDKAQRFILEPTYGFTVFLDAGHGKNASGWGVYDPGAEGSGYEEADLTKDLVTRIAAALKGADVRVFAGPDYSVPYWQRNAKAASLGCDVVLSIHFDAGGGSTTSTMVGTHGASGSSAFNAIIHRKLVGSIGLGDGGTMHRSDITVVNGKVPSVLIEACFIDNSSCLHRYLNRRDSVATNLAAGIVEAAQEPALQR